MTGVSDAARGLSKMGTETSPPEFEVIANLDESSLNGHLGTKVGLDQVPERRKRRK